MSDRIVRISEEYKREISEIIHNELKDPRLPNMVSVVAAEVTKDLKHAKVYISVYGSDEEKQSAIAALKSASGFIRREIGNRMSLRYSPEIQFKLDNSIETGVYITDLINKTVRADNNDVDSSKESEESDIENDDA